MRSARPSAAAFTLVEMMVAAGVVTVLGGVMFTLLTTGMMLYAQNRSISQTHSSGLVSTEKLLVTVAAAAEVPALVNDAGATLTGNGPAAGVRFFTPASSKAYPVNGVVHAMATSFTIAMATGQPAPQVGDKFAMSDLGFQGVINSVWASGTARQIGFASAVGNGFSPSKTSGVVIPSDAKGFLLTPSAFITVNGVLRYYPRALSVAEHGAGAFNDPARYNVIATLVPAGAGTSCLPFQYLDAGRRSIDVNLRVRASAHGGRLKQFYTFQNMKTTIAYRSALTQ